MKTMKRYLYTFLLSLCFMLSAQAQIVINEISYNPPESGTDSLEYIELYNNSAINVDMTDWSLVGVTYTFPNGTMLNAGEYLVVAVNADAMQSVFSVTALQWTSGGLGNGGEQLQLLNGVSDVVDEVTYDDGGDWTDVPDGGGPSLELCDPNEDNSLGANWLPSENGTGVILEGNEVKGTPGAANSVSCPTVTPDYTVIVQNFSFVPADITINVGETIQWECVSGSHNVNGSQATYPTNPEDFINGTAAPAPWTFAHTFNTVGAYDYRCDPHFGSGMVGTVTVVEPVTADLVITEIMYNTPGTDDFEFIEIYNNGADPVDMTGYSFSDGVGFTFPDFTLGAGEYTVVTLDSQFLADNFGYVGAFNWTDGNLGNGGETIRLVDASNNEVDVVIYDDVSPWAVYADGEGPSLVLCDVTADNNDGSNWSFSTTAAGFGYGFLSNTVYASPGAANATCPTAPVIAFDGEGEVVNEGDGSIDVGINFANFGMMDTTDVTIAVIGTSSATVDVDFTFDNTTIGIGGNGPGSLTSGDIIINLVDDTEEEGDETIDLIIAAVTNDAIVISETFTVTIQDNDGLVYPAYTIDEVTTNDAVGAPDSLGVLCELTGIVHGIDLNGGGSVQFTIIDNTGGISLFSSNDFDYVVDEGDEVTVRGAISQFNGLTQISPDTIILNSSNNDLEIPAVVTALGEDTESELIRINSLTIVDPGQWTGTGSGFNVDVTDGTNTYTMRIDNEVDLYSMPAPTGTFDAIGIGGQFDNSEPYDEGYQFLPRYMEDIIPIVGNELLAFDDQASVDENGSVNIDILVNDNIPNMITNLFVDVMPTNGMVVLENDNTATYTPDTDFCGNDSFEYVVCDTETCDTAIVNIEVICEPDFPLYTIGEVSSVDQNGVADSLGVTCEIRGIVYGVNLRLAGDPDGLQFTIIDKDNPNDGIGLFSGGENFGYTVNEGDEVAVQGTIAQFNGLTQINPSNVTLLSSDNDLHDPEVVTVIGESEESKLVKLENMTLVDPSQWTGSGSGFNVDITDGANTYTMRIDNDVDLYSMPAPTFALFNVTGLGGQFDSSDPFTEGYQLLPRYMEDIEEVEISVNDLSLAAEVDFRPNPTSDRLWINTQIQMDQIRVTNMLGQPLMEFSGPQQSTEISVSELPAGLYLLTFIQADRVWTTEFIKQ